MVAAVGQLQFDVLLHRPEHEYGVTARLAPLPFQYARWVVGPDDLVEQVGRFGGRLLVKDSHGAALVLFPDRWSLEHAEKDERLRWLEAAA